MLKRLLLVAYFIEVGLLLVLVPWSPFWERNYFLTALPALQDIVRNNYLRGARVRARSGESADGIQ